MLHYGALHPVRDSGALGGQPHRAALAASQGAAAIATTDAATAVSAAASGLP